MRGARRLKTPKVLLEPNPLRILGERGVLNRLRQRKPLMLLQISLNLPDLRSEKERFARHVTAHFPPGLPFASDVDLIWKPG